MVFVSGHMTRPESVVPTSSGEIEGVARNTTNGLVFTFLGVPYAEPPVGPRRFKKPEPFTPMSGVFSANQSGPSCIQNNIPGFPIEDKSEDCLTLNIFVPKTMRPSKLRSVMVWIHGGGFMIGNKDMYDGSELSLRGEVIVVTMNYRLGLLGFFSTEDHRSPGNYGLWDQRLAIQWVKDNAPVFGGDPNSITIFGESAGGNSVILQTVSLLNTNLFQRTIAQSTYGMEPHILTSGWTEKGKQISEFLNCNDQSQLIGCLRSKHISDILKVQSQITIPLDNSGKHVLGLPIGPVSDGDFLSDSLENLFQGATFRSVDLMAGFNNADGGIFSYVLMGMQSIYQFNYTLGVPKRILCDVYAKDIAEQYFPNYIGAADAICEQYTVSNDVTGQSRAIMDALRDSTFSVNTIRTVQRHSLAETSATYLYQFSYQPNFTFISFSPPWLIGANHADELIYEFGLVQKLSPEEDELSQTVMSYISNFAKHGYVKFIVNYTLIKHYIYN